MRSFVLAVVLLALIASSFALRPTNMKPRPDINLPFVTGVGSISAAYFDPVEDQLVLLASATGTYSNIYVWTAPVAGGAATQYGAFQGPSYGTCTCSYLTSGAGAVLVPSQGMLYAYCISSYSATSALVGIPYNSTSSSTTCSTLSNSLQVVLNAVGFNQNASQFVLVGTAYPQTYIYVTNSTGALLDAEVYPPVSSTCSGWAGPPQFDYANRLIYGLSACLSNLYLDIGSFNDNANGTKKPSVAITGAASAYGAWAAGYDASLEKFIFLSGNTTSPFAGQPWIWTVSRKGGAATAIRPFLPSACSTYLTYTVTVDYTNQLLYAIGTCFGLGNVVISTKYQ